MKATIWKPFVPPRVTRATLLAGMKWTPPIDRERAATAYHEAAHAVVGQVVGQNPQTATIVPVRHSLGRVRRRIRPVHPITIMRAAAVGGVPVAAVARMAVQQAASAVAFSLAGLTAECLWFDEDDPTGAFAEPYSVRGSDGYQATAMARRVFGRRRAEDFFCLVAWQTRAFLNRSKPRKAVARLACLLHQEETIENVRDLIPWLGSDAGILHLSEPDLAEWSGLASSRHMKATQG